MRKRSGALNSDTVEDFVKLALVSQNNQNFFYTNDYIKAERAKGEKNRDRKKSLVEDFDFENKENIPYSWPPGGDLLSQQTTRGNGRTSISKDKEREILFKENPSPRTPESITTVLHKIMVIGEGRCQMRNFIEKLFEKHEDTNEKRLISNPEENFFDLIIKTVRNDETKNLFKFWIQNLFDNDKFKKIIEVYYKTVKLFIFVYDSARAESFEKVKETYQNMTSLSSDCVINSILVDINSEEGIIHKKVRSMEANNFASENCFLSFFEMTESSLTSNLEELYSLVLQFSH